MFFRDCFSLCMYVFHVFENVFVCVYLFAFLSAWASGCLFECVAMYDGVFVFRVNV